jgi:hypothetical protein
MAGFLKAAIVFVLSPSTVCPGSSGPGQRPKDAIASLPRVHPDAVRTDGAEALRGAAVRAQPELVLLGRAVLAVAPRPLAALPVAPRV